MIRGTVNSRREPIVRLQVRGAGGVAAEIDAIVDTGCTAFLTLPLEMVTALGFARHSLGDGVLADNTKIEFETFRAEVEWEGEWRPTLVAAIGKTPLLGTRFLSGHKLVVDVVPGGAVEISPLPIQT